MTQPLLKSVFNLFWIEKSKKEKRGKKEEKKWKIVFRIRFWNHRGLWDVTYYKPKLRECIESHESNQDTWVKGFLIVILQSWKKKELGHLLHFISIIPVLAIVRTVGAMHCFKDAT